MFLKLLQPYTHLVEAFGVGDVVAEKCSVSTAVV